LLKQLAIGIYAKAHSDRYNSSSEFLEFLYGGLGIDGKFFKVGEGRAVLTEDKISDDTAMLRTMAARQEVSELSTANLLLKKQTGTLTEDKEKLLSENEKLEKQQKKL